MKINWGTSIVIVFVLFAAMLTYYMVRGARNPSHLVTENYYEEEIRYQEKIDQKANAAKLNPLHIALMGENISINYPSDLPRSGTTGNVHFYRPNNTDLDKNIALKIDENKAQNIAKSELVSGLWIVKIYAKNGEIAYYWEEKIRI